MDPFLNKNLRSEAKAGLKEANIAWSNCVAQNYLPQWLAGANLNITEVCTEELAKLNESDAENYPEGIPFK
jgi:hypothetical protein